MTDPSTRGVYPRPIPLFGVDAFTSVPFRGNPAAVCLPDEPRSAEWMQAVAAEMNLSETAFASPEDECWQLRWFTPSVEVDLCGHATLATAHVLWTTGRLAPDRPAVFRTRVSGRLTCRREGDWIEMDFPARIAERCDAPSELLSALGCEAVWVGRSRDDFLVQVADAEAVRRLRPDSARLATLPVRGVIVTAEADRSGWHFVSRFFAPGSGIAEDPVTGSAHCSLAPFWAERLGCTELRAWQASRRGGEVRVRIAGQRVVLGGQAATVWSGGWTSDG